MDKIATLQAENVKNIIAHAHRKIPFYKKSLHKIRYKIKYISSSVQWAKVPLLTQQQLIEHAPEIQTDMPWEDHGKVIKNIAFVGQNSPVTFLSNSYTQIIRKSLLARFYQWNDVDYSGLLVEIGSNPDKKGIFKNEIHFPNWGIALDTGKRIRLDAGMGPRKIMEKIIELNPDYLSMPTQLLPTLIGEYGKKKPKLNKLKNIFYFGIPLPQKFTHQGEEMIGTPITGRLEMPGLDNFASQCSRKIFHINAEYYLVEILKEDKKKCTNNQSGRMIISSFHNYNMPLIRYDSGLTVKKIDRCDCGKTLPAFRLI